MKFTSQVKGVKEFQFAKQCKLNWRHDTNYPPVSKQFYLYSSICSAVDFAAAFQTRYEAQVSPQRGRREKKESCVRLLRLSLRRVHLPTKRLQPPLGVSVEGVT